MHLVLMVRVSLRPGLGNNITAATVPTKAEVRVFCVCCHLVCGLLELTFVEENLLLAALTPLQMSHSFLPSRL